MQEAFVPAAGSRGTHGTAHDELGRVFDDQPAEAMVRSDAWSGEMRLALAVVEDALVTVRLTRGVDTPRAQRLAKDAWTWLCSRDTSHPFAFENLCDHLGLDAAWIRSGLRADAPIDVTPVAGPIRRLRSGRRLRVAG